MWNRSRNTTVITCLSCRFGEVYLLQRNRTTFSHVSVRFQLKQRDVSAGVTSCYVSGNTLFSRFRWRDQTKCRRKYWVTFRKQTFLMFLLNYSGLEGTEHLWGLNSHFSDEIFSRYCDKGSKIERQQHRAVFKRPLAIRFYSRFTMFLQRNLFLLPPPKLKLSRSPR